MQYPKVFLAVDNGFDFQRRTEPVDGITVIRNCGLPFVAAGADTECATRYLKTDYLTEWTRTVQRYRRFQPINKRRNF